MEHKIRKGNQVKRNTATVASLLLTMVLAGCGNIQESVLNQTDSLDNQTVQQTEEGIVGEDTLSQEPNTKENENTMPKQGVLPMGWECGTVQALEGENEYTEWIRENAAIGEAADAWTWVNDVDKAGYASAYVALGTVTDGVLQGSLWFVGDGMNVIMLEQQASFADKELQYLDMLQQRYLFVNYKREEESKGRIFLYGDTSVSPLLEGIPGKKLLREDGSIVCMYEAYDSHCKLNYNGASDQPEYVWSGLTEKPYTFVWCEDGGIRGVSAQVLTDEELSKYNFYDTVIEKVEEFYPEGTYQYILRANGELNVNIAGESEDEVTFSYMTFQTNGGEATASLEKAEAELVEQGSGVYLTSVSGDLRLQNFVDYFAGEGHTLASKEATLPWESTKEQSYDFTGYDRPEGSSVAEEWYKEQVIGEVFTPDAELSERLHGLIPDYTGEQWYSNYPQWESIENGTIEVSELAKRVNLIGKADSFLLYGINYGGQMIVEPEEDVYLWLDRAYTSNYEIPPQIQEWDYDGDGETELAINIAVMHGTGVFVEELFMVDKDTDGEWKIYQLLSSWYRDTLHAHIESKNTEEGLELWVDGKKVGNTVDMQGDKTAYFEGGNQISFELSEGEIIMQSTLLAYSNTMFAGMGEGNGMEMRLQYLGEGEWAEKECHFKGALY